jgi:hypothetical protein
MIGLPEFYAGFKGSMGNHFSYSAKIAMQQHHGIPLFVNNSSDMKDFLIRYEEKLNIFNTHVEAEYTYRRTVQCKSDIRLESRFLSRKRSLKPGDFFQLS